MRVLNGRSARAVLGVADGSGPVVAVFLACAGVLSWRALSWPPSERADPWAYTAWGQALARGQRPLYDQTLTTPKPLALALGLVVSPVSPWRAFQAAVVVLLAVLAAALFVAAFRDGGTLGAVVALAALGVSTVATDSLRFGMIDGVAASLVMVALVTRGSTRVACLFVAGLARPEAWLLCGVAGYTEARGSLSRRVLAGALAAAAAPLVWLLVDLLASGDPLASLHRARKIVSTLAPRFHPVSLSHMPDVVLTALGRDVGILVVVVGAVGLLLQARRGIARESFDPLPIAVLFVWIVVVVIETRTVLFEARYLFAATMPLLVGVAVVAGIGLPDRLRGGRALATLAALISFAVATQSMPVGTSLDHRNAVYYRDLVAAVPAIDRALACGPIGITGDTGTSFASRPAGFAPMLAALTRHGLNEFKPSQTQSDLSAVLVLGTGRNRPNDWVGPRFRFGTLAVSPRCARKTHL